ncbi:hypothetical protein KFL_001410020 [Klebsormidium nitens]|uniref:Uncharacterized protein n=1 Tax=Klebsormidium nitens TaxID=105231 RepID=A0A0U9HS83_KLENI|nr:hypothetical protein KFL_001410020 [Klebsormidium nitens]|eukprot:GAQ83244.1 hypothetical protein KFL_001410020 [Klebsormidium nitens]
MAAAALRAAVRQLFQPHIKLQTSAGNAVFLNPALVNPSSRAAGTARAGNLETLNPLLPRLASLQNGASAKLGLAGAATPGHQSLGIARLARVMLNYFGVGATAWAVGNELTGGARTAYASAPKRHAPLADPIPNRPAWQSRSGPFFPSILTSSSPSKEIQRPPSPDASKAPLRELFDPKPTSFERATSPVLSSAYDPNWARARSPPLVGLSGVWTGPEGAGLLKPSPVLGGILEPNGAQKAAEKDPPNAAKGLRISAPAPNSPSAGLGLLMEEPAPSAMAPNIGWELVTSGVSWKGASPVAGEVVPAVKDSAPVAGGSPRIGQAGDLAGSTGWSLVLVGDASEATGDSEAAKKSSGTEEVQKEGSEEGASYHLGSLGSRQVAAQERGQVAAREWSEYGGASPNSTEGVSNMQDAGLSASSSVTGIVRGIAWEGALDDSEGGSSISFSAATGCSTVGHETVPLNTAESAHTKEEPEASSRGLPVYSFSQSPVRSPACTPASEAGGIPLPAAAPKTPPTELPAQTLRYASNANTLLASAEKPGDMPVQSLEKERVKIGEAFEGGAAESGVPLVEASPTESGSLQRRVSAPIRIQQGKPGGHAFAASAPADRARQPSRADVSTRVDEVRLLGEALCHSQTRARRAEEAEASKAAENIRLKELLLFEAMQKNAWQFCLAVETADASLLPVAFSHVATNERLSAARNSDPVGVPELVHSFCDSTDGDQNSNADSAGSSKEIDLVDCIVGIAFGVAIGVVCFGHLGGIGWLCVRVGFMCGNTDW